MVLITRQTCLKLEVLIVKLTLAAIYGVKWSEKLKPAGRRDSGEDRD